MKERAAEVLSLAMRGRLTGRLTHRWSYQPSRCVWSSMIMTVSFIISATLRHSRPARGPLRRRSRHSLAALPRCLQRSPTCVTMALAPCLACSFQKPYTTSLSVSRLWLRSRRRSGVTVTSPDSRLESPWGGSLNVLSSSLEYDGLGALQLATEVTNARLRHFQPMIISSALAD